MFGPNMLVDRYTGRYCHVDLEHRSTTVQQYSSWLYQYSSVYSSVSRLSHVASRSYHVYSSVYSSVSRLSHVRCGALPLCLSLRRSLRGQNFCPTLPLL